MRSANSRRNLSIACRSSSVRRLISSSVAPRSSASRSRSWAARSSRSASERSPSSIWSAIAQSHSATSRRSASLFAARRRSEATRRPMNTPHCGVKRSGSMRSASSAAWTRRRSSGSSTIVRRCSTSARASGLVKGRCGSVKSTGSLRPSCSASSLATRVSFTRAPAQGCWVRSTVALVSASPCASGGSVSAMRGAGTSARRPMKPSPFSTRPSTEAMP